MAKRVLLVLACFFEAQTVLLLFLFMSQIIIVLHKYVRLFAAELPRKSFYDTVEHTQNDYYTATHATSPLSWTVHAKSCVKLKPQELQISSVANVIICVDGSSYSNANNRANCHNYP